MVGSLATKARAGLTARQVVRAEGNQPTAVVVTQLVGQLRPCAIRRQRRRRAQSV